MRQYIVTTGGQAFGLVLDDRPMTDAEAEWHVAAFGARTPGDLVAWARHLAGGHAWTLAELVGRGRMWTACGTRALVPHSYCRLVASHPIPSDAAAAA